MFKPLSKVLVLAAMSCEMSENSHQSHMTVDHSSMKSYEGMDHSKMKSSKSNSLKTVVM